MTQPQSAQSCCLRPSPTLLLPPGMSGGVGNARGPPVPSPVLRGTRGGEWQALQTHAWVTKWPDLKKMLEAHTSRRSWQLLGSQTLFLKCLWEFRLRAWGREGDGVRRQRVPMVHQQPQGPLASGGAAAGIRGSCRELSNGPWLVWSRATARAAFSSIPIPRRVGILPPCETRCWRLHS